jgi:hypothetical protein
MVRVGLYVRQKDEVNIIEFMEHYYSLGFLFILILDDHSQIHPSRIIGNKFNGKYKIIQINKNIINKYPNKTDYFNNIEVFEVYVLPEIKKYMDYVYYSDMDEYLVIKKHKNINEVINFYKPFEQLKINWLFFGNNNIKIGQGLSKLKPLFTKSALKLNSHVKSLVKVDSIKHYLCAHCFVTKNGISKNILNEITNETPFEEKLTNYSFKDVNLYLAHYVTQDTATFIRRRYCRITESITNIAEKINYNTDKNFIKQQLVQYINNNIDNILDYVHGNNDNINLFSNLYADTFKSIKYSYFKGHNCNDTTNVDLCKPYIYLFDWLFYLNRYPDLRLNGIHTEKQAIEHWNMHGKLEGRRASIFNWKYYLDRYPDLRANGIHTEEQAIEHWNKYGKHEDRMYIK